MQKLFFLIVTLVLTACIILWIKGSTTREIKTEIEISAPVNKVWRILMDIERWQDWSPIINKSSGNAALGSTLSITMFSKEADKDGPQYSPIITNFEKPTFFKWHATMIAAFVMSNQKVFELEETITGTRLVHKELFSGMMVPLFWSSVEKEVPTMLNSMNEALKIEAENKSN